MTEHERRRMLVARHRLAGDAVGPDDVARSVVALHATDPASVYLSVLARSSATSLTDVATALYETRSLMRWLAMRRTLFVFPRDDVAMVHAAVGSDLARSLRTQLVNRLRRNGTAPPVTQDLSEWLDVVGDGATRALHRRGAATGAQLAADEPRLRTTIHARTPSERPQNLTTSLLTLLGAEGRIVRGAPTGAWTSRQHLWEPAELSWPEGLPALDRLAAQETLARRWLARFGPALVDDLQWWTGWTKTTTRQVLARLAVDEVDLHGRPGIALPDDGGGHGDEVTDAAHRPVASLLPALDPTPMGWKHRDWFFDDVDPRQVFDNNGNIGPTVWWDGTIIGSWAVGSSGEIRTALLAERSAEAVAAVEGVADDLQRRLDGTAVTPAIRTPLERAIAGSPTNEVPRPPNVELPER